MAHALTQAGWYRWEGDDLVISVRVQPRARRDELGEVLGHERKVRITAPPVEGKANEHLVRFIAQCFGVPAARVTLLAGAQNRSKRLRVRAPNRLPEDLPKA